MSSSPRSERHTYASVRRAPQPVGRVTELAEVETAVRQPGNRALIYVFGVGGIGKTYFLQYVLDRLRAAPDLLVVHELIDLYHTSNQTIEGLMVSIQAALSPTGEGFETYLEQQRALEEYSIQPARNEDEVEARRAAMQKAFFDDLRGLADRRRLVLAFDTAEKLLFTSGFAARRLDLERERRDVVFWLLERFIPALHNAAALLAGRPGKGELRTALEQIADVDLLPVELHGFTEQDALDYFDAIAENARKSKNERDQRTAQVLDFWSQEDRQAIFHSLRDEGDPPNIRPILLALAIDHLVVGGQPRARALGLTLPEALDMTPEQRVELRQDLGRVLVAGIHKYRRPADQIIYALGWLRKGADEQLLAAVTGLPVADVANALPRLRDLSFIKIRPRDGRIFLHDEMYAMLAEFGLPLELGPQRDRVFAAIEKEYAGRIQRARSDIAQVWQGGHGVLPDARDVAAATNELNTALVEDLYYTLQNDALRGFDKYIRYAEEAVTPGAQSLDLLLRAELLAFFGDTHEVAGLKRSDAVADAAVRWVKRLFYSNKKDGLGRAEEVIAKLRTSEAAMIGEGGELAEAELDSWEGIVLIVKDPASSDRALQLMNRSIQRLTVMKPSHDQRYRRSAILARAYNNLGYAHRMLGQVRAAASAYESACSHWNFVDIESELANTLTNWAYATALGGEFDDARNYANDALEKRQHLGPLDAVVLTLTTLAEIETLAGNYSYAEQHAQKALGHATNLQFARGRGLALLPLAAIYRYHSERDVDPKKAYDFLQQAVAYGQNALDVFTKELTEPEREVRAYFELGVSYRELGRHLPADKCGPFMELAENHLLLAIDRAQAQRLWLPYLDASLGLAWTYYYNGRSQHMDDILDTLQANIAQHFADLRIAEGKLPRVGEDTVTAALPQFARLHVLRGMQQLDAYHQHRLPEELSAGAREFTIALEYNALFSRHHQGIARALTTIMKQVRQLDVQEKKAFYDAVADAAKELGLRPTETRLWKELRNGVGPYEEYAGLVGERATVPRE